MSTNGRIRVTQRADNGAPHVRHRPYRLVLLGDSAVGKSSLAARLINDQFDGHEPSTVGASFLVHNMCVNNVTVRLEIWDTAGQERYHSLAPIYYRAAEAALVVYDVTSQDTFVRAKYWVKELQEQASPATVIALVGNKSDLVAKRMVDFEEAQAYADENRLLFMETSAKTAINVKDVFLAIGQQLAESEEVERESVVIQTPKKASCCK